MSQGASHCERLHIYDVSLRDGLQRHSPVLSVEDKLSLYRALTTSGLNDFELTSFVSPKAVPQLADAPEFYKALHQLEPKAFGGRRDALVIDERGLQRAIEAGASGVSLVLIASETLSQRNSRVRVEESLHRARNLIKQAQDAGLYVRAYLAAAWACPYEGLTPTEQSLKIGIQLLDWGADELALADTVGHATPPQIRGLIERLLSQGADCNRLAVHLHDTLSLGLANAYAALEAGVRRIDASIGGLGGCPFAPGAAGNLATEDLVLLAARLGYETGIDLEALYSAVSLAEELTQRSLGGRTRAWWRHRDPNSPLSHVHLTSPST